jgi:hypothetical protein
MKRPEQWRIYSPLLDDISLLRQILAIIAPIARQIFASLNLTTNVERANHVVKFSELKFYPTLMYLAKISTNSRHLRHDRAQCHPFAAKLTHN